MLGKLPYSPGPYDDDWEAQPAQGWFYQWILGVALPIGMCVYGIKAVVTGEATFGRLPMTLHGSNAMAFGLAWCCAGVFVHCHYFWGNIYDQAWFAVLGKILSAVGFIAALGYVLVRNGVYGIQ